MPKWHLNEVRTVQADRVQDTFRIKNNKCFRVLGDAMRCVSTYFSALLYPFPFHLADSMAKTIP